MAGSKSTTPSSASAHREHLAHATRARLLEAAVSLLERGEEITMRSVAAAAEVSERTIYRYHGSREALTDAIREHVRSRVAVPLPETLDALDGYVERLFGMFEDHPALFGSLVSLAAGSLRDEFDVSRSQKLSELSALIDRAYASAPAAERRAAALALRAQLSASTWFYMRVSCGMPREEVLRAARWSVLACLDRLQRASRARRALAP